MTVAVLAFGISGLIYAYVHLYRPDLVESAHRRKMEREKAQAAAKTERSGKLAGGIVQGIFAALKNKPQ
jgi:hypothetical protein